MSSSYRLTLENYLKDQEIITDSLIDIGGSQKSLEGRVKTLEVQDYKTADLPNPHEGKKSEIELDLNQEYTGEEKADMVTCLEVMEYVYDPMMAFKNIYNLLNAGGEALVTFPTFYPVHNPIEDDSLRYMPSGIKKLAKANNLDIIEMTPRYAESIAIEQAWRVERMKAARNHDHSITGYIVRFRRKI